MIARVRREFHDARHHGTAMVLGPDGQRQRSDDDGEPAGTTGAPILAVLRGSGLTDVVAVVSRYFGGTLLGAGGLVRAYGDAVAAALEDARRLRQQPVTLLSLRAGHTEAGRLEHRVRTWAVVAGASVADGVYGPTGATYSLVVPRGRVAELRDLLAASDVAHHLDEVADVLSRRPGLTAAPGGSPLVGQPRSVSPGRSRPEQGDHLGVRGLTEVVVPRTHRTEVAIDVQRDQVRAGSADLVGALPGGDRDGDGDRTDIALVEDRHRRRHRAARRDPVVHEQHPAALDRRGRSVTAVPLDPPGELASLLGGPPVEVVARDAEVGDHPVVDHQHVGLADRPDRELRSAGSAELAHDEDVQRGPEHTGDRRRDRHPAPGQREHDRDAVRPRDGGEFARQQPTGTDPVREARPRSAHRSLLVPLTVASVAGRPPPGRVRRTAWRTARTRRRRTLARRRRTATGGPWCWRRSSSPADVKALGPDDLEVLAEEVRAAIIGAVSQVGGHLGSNLGAVELSIALHRVFSSPEDVLLWDTGHQAYVHKMLTGRAGMFDTLRQAGGLSGYPSRAESDHDVIENSHASTALSWAFGIARGQAARPLKERQRVVAIVGDGALTGGMAYEALNNLGHHRLPALIVLNDNGRSYAETVGRLSERMSDLRTDPRYRVWRAKLDQTLARVPTVERFADAGFEGIKQLVSDAPALQNFVEALGVRYLGPVDGHDVERVEHALATAARTTSGPVLVHVLTEKGKGYAPAETDLEKHLHDTSAFDVTTGRAGGGAAKPRGWTAAFSDAIVDLGQRRPDIIAITAAMPENTGLLPLAAVRPDQVLDVGIAEQHAVTAAAGMSRAGLTPVIAVYSTFFARAFDQANLDVGLHDEHVVFCFDRAGITGDDGASHHGVLDLSLMLRIPTATVLAPSTEEDLVALLETAVDLGGPVSLRFPKYAVVSAADLGLDGPGEGLSARCVRSATGDAEVCVLAVGDRVGPAIEAAALLADHDIDAVVWDVRSVRPADPRCSRPRRRHRSWSPSRTGTSRAAPARTSPTGSSNWPGSATPRPCCASACRTATSSTPSPTGSWPSSAWTPPVSRPRSARSSPTTDPPARGVQRGGGRDATVPLRVLRRWSGVQGGGGQDGDVPARTSAGVGQGTPR